MPAIPVIYVDGAAPPVGESNIAVGATVTFSVNNSAEFTSFAWSIISRPQGFAGSLSASLGFTTTLAVATPGEYRIRGVGTGPTGANSQRVTLVVVRTANKNFRKSVSVADVVEKYNEATDILDAAVISAALADGAVTTAKILDAAITTPKLADLSVTTAKLAGGAVTDAKIDTSGGLGTYLRTVRSVTPTGVAATDTAAVQAALDAMSGVGEVRLLPGSFSVNSPISPPDNTVLVLHPNTALVSTLAPGGNETNCTIARVTTLSDPSTTTNGAFDPDTATYADRITLTDASGFAVGHEIVLFDSLHVWYGRIVGKASNTITVDRPIVRAFPSGATVRHAVWPKRVRIHGNGAKITGTGSQAFELAGAERCLLEGIRVTGDDGYFSNEIAVYDTGSRDSEMRDCEFDCGSTTSVGYSSESGERITFRRMVAYGAVTTGGWTADGIGNVYEDCHAWACAQGLTINDQNSPVSYGSRKVTVRGGSFSRNTTYGVTLGPYSTDCLLDGVQADNNGSDGFFVTGAAGGKAPTGNTLRACKARHNAGSGFNIDADGTILQALHAAYNATGVYLSGSATKTIGSDIQANNSTGDGVWADTGSAGTKLVNVTTSDCVRYGLYLLGEVEMQRWTSADCGTGATKIGCYIGSAASVTIDGFRLTRADGTGWIGISINATGDTRLKSGTVSMSANNGIGIGQNTGTLWIDNVRTPPGAAGAYGSRGYYGDAPVVIRIGPGVNFASTAFPFGGTGTRTAQNFTADGGA